jgi:3-methyladenine DNA glycosylase AlkD
MTRRSDSKTTGGTRKSSINTSLEEIIKEIARRGDPRGLTGMSRYGITVARAYGVSVPQLRDIARKIGTDHRLALQLWKTEIHEARILAGMIDDPRMVTENQMENWASRFRLLGHSRRELCEPLRQDPFC